MSGVWSRLGGEVDDDVLALEGGGDGVEVGEVGGEGVEAVEGDAVDAAEFVLVAEVVAQDLADLPPKPVTMTFFLSGMCPPGALVSMMGYLIILGLGEHGWTG